MTAELPLWYIFRSVSSAVIQQQDQTQLLINRVLLLTSKDRDTNFSKDIYETQEEYQERMDLEIFGHGLIRFVAGIDMRVSSWLVESEGDLFSYRFQNSKLPEKKNIMEHLFGHDKIYLMEELSELFMEELDEKFNLHTTDEIRKYDRSKAQSYKVKDQFGLNRYIALHYSVVPFLLKQRKGLLYKGWVLIRINDVLSLVKRQFEKLLSERIEAIGEQINDDPHLQGRAKRLQEVLENENIKNLIKPKYDDFELEGIPLDGTIEDHHLKLPPCIQDLLIKVNATGYIGHWERFQLGIFLKTTGMDINEQLRFWYNKAVDNVGMTFESFNRRAGYIIRHIYGMEGGKIDYTMPSCKTIQDKMYCSFKHSNLETIKSKIEAYIEGINSPALQQSRKIISLKVLESSSKLDYSNACRYFLSLVTGRMYQQAPRVYHPFQYLKLAAESTIASEFNLAGKKETATEETDHAGKEEEQTNGNNIKHEVKQHDG